MGFRGQYDEHRRFQIAMLKHRGLLPHHRFLEIGCGPLTGAIPVIKYLDRGNFIGVDFRPSVLNIGWPEIGYAGLSEKNPRLICSTSFGREEIEQDKRFDFILSFSVLFHLSDELLPEYFRQVASRLKPTGAGSANINTTLDSSRWLEFPFLKRTTQDYIDVAARSNLSAHALGTIESLGFRQDGAERVNDLWNSSFVSGSDVCLIPGTLLQGCIVEFVVRDVGLTGCPA